MSLIYLFDQLLEDNVGLKKKKEAVLCKQHGIWSRSILVHIQKSSSLCQKTHLNTVLPHSFPKGRTHLRIFTEPLR